MYWLPLISFEAQHLSAHSWGTPKAQWGGLPGLCPTCCTWSQREGTTRWGVGEATATQGATPSSEGIDFSSPMFFFGYPGPGSSWEGQGRRAGKAKGPRAATGTTSEAAERSRCGGQATVRKGGMSWGGGLNRIVMVEVSSFCRLHWQTCELKMGGVNIPSNLMPTQTVNPSQASAPARHRSPARRRAGCQGSRRGGCATAPCHRAQPQAPGWRSSGKATRLQGWWWAIWWICKRCIFFTWCVTMM